MQDVPKIVRDRLLASATVAHHPDADLLTAFAERSLPESERAGVLGHLARCKDCRDVVALSLPPREVATATLRPARRGWFTWPSLRWGFVTAGLIAIGAVGMLQYQRHLSPQTVALKEGVRNDVAVNEPHTPPAAEPVSPPADLRDKAENTRVSASADSARNQALALTARKSMPPSEASAPARVAPAVGSTAAGAVLGERVRHGPNATTNSQQQVLAQGQQVANAGVAGRQQAGQFYQPERVPSVSETVEVEGAAPHVSEENAELKNLPTPAQSDDSLSAKVDRAKPAMESQLSGGAAPASAAMQPRTDLARAYAAPVLPRWTIGSSGTLQRSFDQGKTWQDVEVTPDSTLSANLMSLAVVSKASGAREEDKDESRALKKQKTATSIFRAVAANGADVWAGGSNGFLLHSVDAGGHWMRVVPSSSSTSLTGDILAVEFSDLQHGKITTSAHEVWTTGDNGRTWQEQ